MKAKKVVIELFQYSQVGVYETMKVEKGKQPEKVRTGTTKVKTSALTNQFSVTEAVKVDETKLAQTLVKAMSRRYEAYSNGVDMGWKPSKDSFISVSVEGKEVFNLETVKLRSSVQSRIKFSAKAWQGTNADKDADKKRVEAIILFTIQDARISVNELKGVFK